MDYSWAGQVDIFTMFTVSFNFYNFFFFNFTIYIVLRVDAEENNEH